MSHQRSSSTSQAIGIDIPSSGFNPREGLTAGGNGAPIQRQRSMSTSFPFVAPTSSSSGGANPAAAPFTGPSFGTTPPTNLSTSIPATFGRRFSSSFTNPLTQIVSPTSTQFEERGRRASVFGPTISPTLSRQGSTPMSTHPFDSAPAGYPNNGANPAHAPTTSTAPPANNHGGIGGLFRRLSSAGTTMPTTGFPSQQQQQQQQQQSTDSLSSSLPSTTFQKLHAPDRNEAGPSPPSLGPLSNMGSGQDMPQAKHRSGLSGLFHREHSHKQQPPQQQQHMTTVDSLKASNQQQQKGGEKNSRSSSPMRNMILNGQMLD